MYMSTETEHHLQRHENELAVLAIVGQLMATETGQRQMLVQVLGQLEQALGMRRVTVMLLSPDGQELVFEAAPGSDLHEAGEIRYRNGEGVIGSVLKTGRTEIIPRIAQEPRFRNRIHRRGLPCCLGLSHRRCRRRRRQAATVEGDALDQGKDRLAGD